jgi:hypothetical protein
MAVDFTKVPIGTRVETPYGPGVIDSVFVDSKYPVRIRLDSGMSGAFLADGREFDSHTRPTMFLAPFQWPEQEQPLPDLAVDAPVMVRFRGGSWERRHFCRWVNGRCAAYDDGFTSWTTKNTTTWNEWRLPTKEELKGKINE